MTSKHFDDLLLLAEVWKPGKLPSELLTYYAPEVARRWQVTPADWYAFDLAATARWSELQREANERQRELSAPGRSRRRRTEPASPTLRSGAVVDDGGGERLAIRGNEIPPWDRRYRISSR